MASWNVVLSNTRIIENRLQSKLQLYSSAIRNFDISCPNIEKQSEDIENMCESIQTMIRNYVTSLDELTRIADYQADPKYNSIIERQKAVLIDFRKDFNRMNVACTYFHTRQDILSLKRERQQLLHPQRVHSMSSDDSDVKALLKERGAVHASLQMADSYLDRATESHSLLVNQRKRLESSHSKVRSVFTRLPMVNELMRKIGDKKTRDNVIVAFVMACCIFFCIWYILHSRLFNKHEAKSV